MTALRPVSLLLATSLALAPTRLVLAQPVPEAPSAQSQAQAQKLYTDGQKAYEAQRYDGALIAWNRSYELSKLPALLFNIAQAYRLRGLSGDCNRATEAYRRFIDADPKSPQRASAEGFIRELASCATTTPGPAPAPAPSGPAPSPGPVAGPPAPAPAPSKQPPAVSAGAAAGGSELGPIAGPPVPGPAPRDSGPGMSRADKLRIASYATAGGGVVSLLFAAYFGDKASSLGDEVSDACKAGCDWATVSDKDEDGRAAERNQWIFVGVGITALAASGALFYLSTREQQRSTVAIVPRGDGAEVSWTTRW